MITPLKANEALDRFFLEARCKILDVAAILDRVGRGLEAAEMSDDPRIAQIREALEVVHDQSGGRAERIQKIFSMDYDPDWDRPKPK